MYLINASLDKKVFFMYQKLSIFFFLILYSNSFFCSQNKTIFSKEKIVKFLRLHGYDTLAFTTLFVFSLNLFYFYKQKKISNIDKLKKIEQIRQRSFDEAKKKINYFSSLDFHKAFDRFDFQNHPDNYDSLKIFKEIENILYLYISSFSYKTELTFDLRARIANTWKHYMLYYATTILNTYDEAIYTANGFQFVIKNILSGLYEKNDAIKRKLPLAKYSLKHHYDKEYCELAKKYDEDRNVLIEKEVNKLEDQLKKCISRLKETIKNLFTDKEEWHKKRQEIRERIKKIFLQIKQWKIDAGKQSVDSYVENNYELLRNTWFALKRLLIDYSRLFIGPNTLGMYQLHTGDPNEQNIQSYKIEICKKKNKKMSFCYTYLEKPLVTLASKMIYRLVSRYTFDILEDKKYCVKKLENFLNNTSYQKNENYDKDLNQGVYSYYGLLEYLVELVFDQKNAFLETLKDDFKFDQNGEIEFWNDLLKKIKT